MNLNSTFYTVAWAIWVLYFLVLETLALKDIDKGDTFSEHVWAVIFQGTGPRPVVYYVFGGFLVWVIVHFLFRGRLG